MQHINPAYHHTSLMLKNEQRWICQAQKNPEDFAPLYTKYHDQIFRYVYQHVNDKHVAGDLTSQVFLKAICNLRKFQFRGVPLASWLFRIAKSEVNQSFRNKKNKYQIDLEEVHLYTFMEVFEKDTNEPNVYKLKAALKKLSEEELTLIKKRYFEEYKYKEIGELLFITENNAKVKTFRALNHLKELFEKEGKRA